MDKLAVCIADKNAYGTKHHENPFGVPEALRQPQQHIPADFHQEQASQKPWNIPISLMTTHIDDVSGQPFDVSVQRPRITQNGSDKTFNRKRHNHKEQSGKDQRPQLVPEKWTERAVLANRKHKS